MLIKNIKAPSHASDFPEPWVGNSLVKCTLCDMLHYNIIDQKKIKLAGSEKMYKTDEDHQNIKIVAVPIQPLMCSN